MTEKLPEDNTCEEEMDSRIADLAEKCMRLKAAKDASEKAFKMAKSELETLCDEHKIGSIDTGNVVVTLKKQRRFREYREPGTVFKLIPEQYKNYAMSLDRKKINALIDTGVLPQEIKDEEAYSESTVTTFKKVA